MTDFSDDLRAMFVKVCPIELEKFEAGLYNRKTELRLAVTLKGGDSYSFFTHGRCIEPATALETMCGWAVRVNEKQALKRKAS